MSTQINARSPFYIEAEAPTITLGTFTCDVASLSNFSVASDGTITEPNVLRGTIIDRDYSSFPALSIGDSSVSRTVNYTILIPSGYSNTSDGTISCSQTFTQVAPSASCNVSTNTNMATFAGPIGNITNLNATAQTVSLGSFFTQQGGATFKKYTISRVGSSAIEFSLSGTGVSQTLSFTTASTGVSATFTVTAHNNDDSCTTSSNSFTVTAEATGSLACSDLNITGGSITQGGTITRPSFEPIASIYKVYVGATDYTSTDYPDNTNTNDRTVTLKLYFRVPSAYDNATPSGSTDLNDFLLCTKDVFQSGTSLHTVACGDDIIAYRNIRIASTGDIVSGDGVVTVGGVEAEFSVNTKGVGTDNAFPRVRGQTPRDIGVDIVVPSGYSNTGSTISCTISREQPPEVNACAGVTGTYYITTPASSATGHCGLGNFNAKSSVNGIMTEGEVVCKNGTAFNGQNLWYGASNTLAQDYAGDTGATYRVIQIDEEGIIRQMADINCDTGTEAIL